MYTYTWEGKWRLTLNTMSKTELRKYIQLRIKRLNVLIDRKIVLGQSYKKEAAEHSALFAKLKTIA